MTKTAYIKVILLLFVVLQTKGSVVATDFDSKGLVVRERRDQFFSAWAAAGYSALMTNMNHTSPLGFVGGLAGIGYGIGFGGPLSFHIGAEFALLTSSTRPFAFTQTRDAIDTEGMAFEMIYQYKSYREYQQAPYVNIPISVDYSYKKFYCALGAKVGLPLSWQAYAKTSGNLKTTGHYNQFIEDFEEMPNHYFLTSKVTDQNTLVMGINAIVHGEIGYNIDLESRREYSKTLRIAFFADYGINNIVKNDPTQSLVEYNTHPMRMHFNSLLTTNDNRVNSVMGGIKVTFIFTQHIVDCYCNTKKK
ncbi:hypothetical protein AGMMS4956_02340 [Bacteroidia bacterium]|nr:hypothetical protein AGMMS4956_02340 [Bacteroidia bacterium]